MTRLRMSRVIVKTFDLLIISKKEARDASGEGACSRINLAAETKWSAKQEIPVIPFISHIIFHLDSKLK